MSSEARWDPWPVALQAGARRLGPVCNHGGVVEPQRPCCIAASVDPAGLRSHQSVGGVLRCGVDDRDPQHHVVDGGEDDHVRTSPRGPEDVVAADAEMQVVELHHVPDVCPGKGEEAAVAEDALSVPLLPEHPAGLAVLNRGRVDVPGADVLVIVRGHRLISLVARREGHEADTTSLAKVAFILRRQENDVLGTGPQRRVHDLQVVDKAFLRQMVGEPHQAQVLGAQLGLRPTVVLETSHPKLGKHWARPPGPPGS